VNANAEVVQTGSGDDSALSISETAYLLRSPANAARLRQAIADAVDSRNRITANLDSPTSA
jgi:PHD/YefM family antitoxin component YafN of YafNO toxin-antitoxin module